MNDYELAKRMIKILVDENEPITYQRAIKIIDIAKSMVSDIAIIYYK